MENIPHTTGRLTRSRARQSSQTPLFGGTANAPATVKTAKSAFFSGGDAKPVTPRRALFDISNQHSPAPTSAGKAISKPDDAIIPEAKLSPAKEEITVSECDAPATHQTPVKDLDEPEVSASVATDAEINASPLEQMTYVHQSTDCQVSSVESLPANDASTVMKHDEIIEEPVEDHILSPVAVCAEEDATVSEKAGAMSDQLPALTIPEPDEEIVVDYSAMGTPSLVVLESKTLDVAPSPEALSNEDVQNCLEATSPESLQESVGILCPTSSAKQDRWALESPFERTTPGTWAACIAAEDDADTACMPASTIVPTPSFDPRSLKSIRNAIKNAAAAKVDAFEERHQRADADWEDGEDNEADYDGYEEEDAEWDEYGYEDAAEDVEEICQILDAMGLAEEKLHTFPAPQGQHIRFEEENAVVSPSRSRVLLRGVPAPEGKHIIFN